MHVARVQILRHFNGHVSSRQLFKDSLVPVRAEFGL